MDYEQIDRLATQRGRFALLAEKEIRKMRNANKKALASDYVAFLCGRITEDQWTAKLYASPLSIMGQQAIWLHFDPIFEQCRP